MGNSKRDILQKTRNYKIERMKWDFSLYCEMRPII